MTCCERRQGGVNICEGLAISHVLTTSGRLLTAHLLVSEVIIRLLISELPVGVERGLEGGVEVSARQVRAHHALVLLEGVPGRVGGGTAARATRGGSLDLRGGGQAPVNERHKGYKKVDYLYR